VDDQVIAAVVGGLAGLASGALASVVAPWVNWGIEKRRFRLQRRRELVGEWRAGLADAEANGLFGGGGSYEHLPGTRACDRTSAARGRVGDGPRIVSSRSGTGFAGSRCPSPDRPLPELSSSPRQVFGTARRSGSPVRSSAWRRSGASSDARKVRWPGLVRVRSGHRRPVSADVVDVAGADYPVR